MAIASYHWLEHSAHLSESSRSYKSQLLQETVLLKPFQLLTANLVCVFTSYS